MNAYKLVSKKARDASIALNNAAVTLPEGEWLEVQDLCRQLEKLADLFKNKPVSDPVVDAYFDRAAKWGLERPASI